MKVEIVDMLHEIHSLLKMLNAVRMDELCESGYQGVHLTLETALSKTERLMNLVGNSA